MANFEIAYIPVARAEGGYVNDPTDKGGETIFGLTRRDWPNWSGWHTVDEFKGQPKFVSIVNSSIALKDSVKGLFKANYWNPLNLDLVTNDQIAHQVFDTGINMGVGTAAKFMQQCAGVTVDLHVGPKTIEAVNKIDPEIFYNCFLGKRKAKYDAIIADNPAQVRFKKSWYSRLTPYKK